MKDQIDVIQRIDEMLDESFDTNIKVKIDWENGWRFDLTFEIEGNPYGFRAERDDNESLDIWCVEFGNYSLGSDTYGITGTGNQMKVFAVVAKCLDMFLKRKKPDIFWFSAEEPSRKKLYRRFAKTITKKYPYNILKDNRITDRLPVKHGNEIYAFRRR